MRIARIAGVVLLVAGVVLAIVGSVPYDKTHSKEVFGVRMSVTERKEVRVPLAVSVGLAAFGAGLVAATFLRARR